MKLCSRNFHRVGVCAVLLVTAVGCSKKIYPVEGRVLVDGEPMEAVLVTLEPASGGAPAAASTQSDGRFKIVSAGGKGVAPGEYTVTLSKTTGQKPDSMPPWVRRKNPPTDEERAEWERKKSADKAMIKQWMPDAYVKATTTPIHLTVPSKEELTIELSGKDMPVIKSADKK